MKIDFAYKKTSTKSRFEKDARGNSEMAYSSPVTCSASVTFGKEPSTDQVVDAAILDCLYRIQDGGPIRKYSLARQYYAHTADFSFSQKVGNAALITTKEAFKLDVVGHAGKQPREFQVVSNLQNMQEVRVNKQSKHYVNSNLNSLLNLRSPTRRETQGQQLRS